MSLGIGAYAVSSSIVASEAPVVLSALMTLTLPTETPEIRTSASWDSVAGLAEGDVEAVALGLQRDRAAEGQPQEEQQAEAGEREARHDEDAAEAGSLLLHLAAPPRPRTGSVGTVGAVGPGCAGVDAGLAGRRAHDVLVGRVEQRAERAELRAGPLSWWSTCSVEHEARTRPWRIGPCASWVEKTVAPAWLAHAAQNR